MSSRRAFAKEVFARSLSNRVLIPMTRFYEWDTEGYKHSLYLKEKVFS